uniref:VWFA domain-containing protein n=1 Tax=Plectus sambesii TaxID=2011161 RepID=A0A914X8Y5_9BILA
MSYFDPCATVQCENGGTCMRPTESQYPIDYYKEWCKCANGWSGAYCTCAGTTQRNVIFLLGNTPSVGNQSNYDKMMKLCGDIVDDFGIESNNTQVAAVTFGGTPKIAFGFASYRNRQQIKNAFLSLSYSSAPAFLGA